MTSLRMQSAIKKCWRESTAVGQRILTELFRQRRSLISWAIFPLMILVLNGLIIAERSGLSQAKSFQEAAPISLVGVALFFSGLGGTVATVVSEREHQTLRRLFLTPLQGLAYFLGIVLAQGAIALGQAGLVIGVARLAGAELQGGLVLALLIVFLSLLSYVGTGFLLGTQVARRTEDVNAIVSTFGIPLLILGGSFLPARFFPKTLLNLAQFDPVYHMNEALLAVWTTGASWGEIADHLRFLGVYATTVLLFSWLAYRQLYRLERRI
jgi:ABC-2 type transport system permease protein